MIKKYLTFSFISVYLSFCFTLFAQTHQPLIIRSIQQYESGKGAVQIIQDRRVGELVTKYIDTNPYKRSVEGYRIHIYSDNKQGADKRTREIRSKFVSNFPDIEAYISYRAPDWKIYVGNFRTRTEAFRVKKQIETLFPDAFIVDKVKIEYSKF